MRPCWRFINGGIDSYLRCQLPQLHPWLHIIDSYWIYLDIKTAFRRVDRDCCIIQATGKPRLDQNQIPAAISQEFCQANQHLTSTIAVGGWFSRWVFSLRSHRNDAGWNSNSLLLAAIFWEHLGRMEDAAVTTGEVEFHASYRRISHRSGAKMDLQMVPGRHIFGAFEIPSCCQSTPRRSEKGTIEVVNALVIKINEAPKPSNVLFHDGYKTKPKTPPGSPTPSWEAISEAPTPAEMEALLSEEEKSKLKQVIQERKGQAQSSMAAPCQNANNEESEMNWDCRARDLWLQGWHPSWWTWLLLC